MKRIDYKWVILATGFTVLFFSGGSRFAMGLMLKPMSEELEVSRSVLSAAITTFMVVSSVALLFFGWLVDRWSLRGAMAIAAVIGGLGIGLMGRVEAPWQVFILYGLVYAIGNAGASVVPVLVMVSGWFADRRGIANGVSVSGNAIGQMVIVAGLAAVLLEFGWRSAFTVLGAANLAILVPLVLLLVRPAPVNPDAAMQPSPSPSGSAAIQGCGGVLPQAPTLREELTSPQLKMLAAIYFICGFHDFFVVTHIVAFAQDQNVGAVLAGNLLAFMGLMGLLGVLAAGVLSDAYGAARPTLLCFVMRIAIFAAILFWQSTPGVIAFGVLYGFTFLMTAPLTVVFVANIFGARRLGALSATISMVHTLAGGLGAMAGGAFFDLRGSYDGAFVLMLALSVAAALLTLLVRERPQGAAATA